MLLQSRIIFSVHVLQNLSLHLRKCSVHNPSTYNPSTQHRHVSHQNQIVPMTPGCIDSCSNGDKLFAVCQIQGVCIKHRTEAQILKIL